GKHLIQDRYYDGAAANPEQPGEKTNQRAGRKQRQCQHEPIRHAALLIGALSCFAESTSCREDSADCLLARERFPGHEERIRRTSRTSAARSGESDGALPQYSCGSPVMISIFPREKGRSAKSASGRRLREDIEKLPLLARRLREHSC